MSDAAANPADSQNATHAPVDASPAGKGKSKAVDEPMDEDDEEEDEDEEMASDEEDDDEEEEEFEEIDPSAIIGGRRTRGVKVDYTSKEALEKAGLNAAEAAADDEDDEDIKA